MQRFSCHRKLTHTVTHTGKRTDGTHGAKSFRPHPFCGKNARKALYTNGWRAFYHLASCAAESKFIPPCGGNPPSSSKKSCFLSKAGLFLYFFANLICGSRCGTVLTHTATHTRKCAERAKKERKGSSAIYQMAFATFNAQYAYSFIF